MNIISPIEIFIALFIGMGPVKVLLIYIAMTEGMERSVRRQIALAHPLHQHAALVLIEQRIPLVPPNHLNDIPPGPDEQPFQLLNDLPIAAYRAIQPLQITIHNENQIVEAQLFSQ